MTANSTVLASRYVEEFLNHIRAVRRLSQHTVVAYQRDLSILQAGLAPTAPEDAQAVDLRRLIVADKKGKAATISRRLASWRSFFDYLLECGVVATNPARLLVSPKSSPPLPKSLTPDEMMGLLAADSKPQSKNSEQDGLVLRDFALIELLYSSALRLSELVALDLSDLDLASGLVYVRQGKGGRGRVAPVGAAAQAALKQWLVVRRQYMQQATPALFVSRAGERLSHRTIQKRLQRHAQRLGVGGNISPHMLRHSCASHFLQSSHDLRATQELLGHRNIATTQIYTRLDYQHLAEIYDKAHPRARQK